MRDAQQEPVQLRLGQRERAFQLDRVLGRQHEEGVGQRPGRAVDGDLALLHRLQQRRLRARRGAVDLVDQQHVREDRAGDEAERAALQDAGARDVRGQQVGRALDAPEVEPERLVRPRAPAASCRRPARPRSARGPGPAARRRRDAWRVPARRPRVPTWARKVVPEVLAAGASRRVHGGHRTVRGSRSKRPSYPRRADADHRLARPRPALLPSWRLRSAASSRPIRDRSRCTSEHRARCSGVSR